MGEANQSFEELIRNELIDFARVLNNLHRSKRAIAIDGATDQRFVQIMNIIKAYYPENYSMDAKGLLEKEKNNTILKSLISKRIANMLLNFDINKPTLLEPVSKFIDNWTDILMKDISSSNVLKKD